MIRKIEKIYIKKVNQISKNSNFYDQQKRKKTTWWFLIFPVFSKDEFIEGKCEIF